MSGLSRGLGLNVGDRGDYPGVEARAFAFVEGELHPAREYETALILEYSVYSAILPELAHGDERIRECGYVPDIAEKKVALRAVRGLRPDGQVAYRRALMS